MPHLIGYFPGGGGNGGASIENMFTYTGDYKLVDEGDGNWRIRFLTSGTFTPKKGMTIDAFAVGGGGSGRNDGTYGGGGGGGGCTKMVTDLQLIGGNDYKVTVGDGGASLSTATEYSGAVGGTSSFDTFLYAAGGSFSDISDLRKGGDGGSGGGSYASVGGSNGSNGGNGGTRDGKGQGTTTREFHESNGTLYAGGGGGGATSGNPYAGGEGGGGDGYNSTNGEDGEENTGGGGGGSRKLVGKGGSGIVVIRNAR